MGRDDIDEMAFFAISFALIAGLRAPLALWSGLIALFRGSQLQGRSDKTKNIGDTNTYFAPATCQTWAEYTGPGIDGLVVIVIGR